MVACAYEKLHFGPHSIVRRLLYIPKSGHPFAAYRRKFNDHLRWKRYDAAARLITPEEQSTFYEALSDVEETLDIQNIEVRHVSVQHTEPVKARVIVRSQSTSF